MLNLFVPIESLAKGNDVQRQVARWCGYLEDAQVADGIKEKAYKILDKLLFHNDDMPIVFPWGTLSRHVRWDGEQPGIVINGRTVSEKHHLPGPRHKEEK